MIKNSNKKAIKSLIQKKFVGSFLRKLRTKILPLRRVFFFFRKSALIFFLNLFGRKPNYYEESLINLSYLKNWCKIVKIYWRDQGLFKLKKPCAILPIEKTLLSQDHLVKIFDQYLSRLNGVKIEGTVGMLFLPNGLLLRENHFFWKNIDISPSCYFIHIKKSRFLAGPVFSLIGFAPTSYYHWMTDSLYRLEVTKNDLPPDTRFLVPSSALATQIEALEAFQINHEQLIFVAKGEVVETNDLWWSPPIMSSGINLPQVSRRLSARFRDFFTTPASDCPNKIYITRSGASRRRILNEPELVAALECRDFKAIKCESLSLSEQACIFRHAEIIIAPHGAGLTNLLFAPIHTSVLELFPSKIPGGAICYWSLCQALGISYTYLTGEDAPSEYSEPDFFINIEIILNWLDSTQKSSASPFAVSAHMKIAQ
jgi:hypothetical protein